MKEENFHMKKNNRSRRRVSLKTLEENKVDQTTGKEVLMNKKS